MSLKSITIAQLMQISVRKDMKSTKDAIFEQKTTKSIHSWSNHFWNPYANVSVKVQYEKTSMWNLKHSIKFFIPRTEVFIPINTRKWKRSCNQFPSFLSEPIWAPGQRHVCFSKNPSFFLVTAGQKHISGTRRATNEQVHWKAPITSFEAQILQYTK